MEAHTQRAAEGLGRRLSEKWRVGERIAKANQWAAAHRKRTAALTIGALVLSLMLNAVLTTMAPGQQENGMGSIENVQPMFTGLQHIQAAKSFQLRQMNGMALQGQHIRTELDSLAHLPVKNSGDSAEIIRKYRQLEIIVKNLKGQ